MQDLALTFGLRYDIFDARTSRQHPSRGSHGTLNPRLAVSTVLHGATFVASWGRFSQAPDYQYLVDAAFDDTTRTGRFRVGNPNLGFEQATQYEFSVRSRPSDKVTLKVERVRQAARQGLVASVPFGLNPDSTIFGNLDHGSAGARDHLRSARSRTWGCGVLHTAAGHRDRARMRSGSGARPRPGGRATRSARRVDEFPLDYDQRQGLTLIAQARAPEGVGPLVLGVRPLAGWQGAAIFHFATGLPYTRTNATGDSLLGPINRERLPSQYTLDALLRRPLRVAGLNGSIYLDVRNVLDTRNLISVRRDTGQPGLSDAGIQAAALAAYQANPQAIPYESPRYRGWADTNHDGVIAGQSELLPLYVAAARDFYQPLFAYGPPRLVRLGVELIF